MKVQGKQSKLKTINTSTFTLTYKILSQSAHMVQPQPAAYVRVCAHVSIVVVGRRWYYHYPHSAKEETGSEELCSHLCHSTAHSLE